MFFGFYLKLTSFPSSFAQIYLFSFKANFPNLGHTTLFSPASIFTCRNREVSVSLSIKVGRLRKARVKEPHGRAHDASAAVLRVAPPFCKFCSPPEAAAAAASVLLSAAALTGCILLIKPRHGGTLRTMRV